MTLTERLHAKKAEGSWGVDDMLYLKNYSNVIRKRYCALAHTVWSPQHNSLFEVWEDFRPQNSPVCCSLFIAHGVPCSSMHDVIEIDLTLDCEPSPPRSAKRPRIRLPVLQSDDDSQGVQLLEVVEVVPQVQQQPSVTPRSHCVRVPPPAAPDDLSDSEDLAIVGTTGKVRRFLRR